ncbi:NAD(P)-dependent dehydrogenase (short-subunit alcohol dehydrogenase family) [Paenibacillus mucilaginosus]
MGIVAAPLIGFYCASKWAVEALHDSLAQEVKSFGIKVTLLEPGAFATDFGSPMSMKTSQGLEVYAELRNRVSVRLSTEERGDPNATAEAILQIIDAEDPPLRFAVGAGVLPLVRGVYADRLATWETWEAVSNGAQGTPISHR